MNIFGHIGPEDMFIPLDAMRPVRIELFVNRLQIRGQRHADQSGSSLLFRKK